MYHRLLFQAAIGLIIIAFSGCTGRSTEKTEQVGPQLQVAKAEPVIGNETKLLLQDLEENGDYVNSQSFPSLIKASIVRENLGSNMLIIDIRKPAEYVNSHIRGAVNKKFEELPVYFETGIRPFEYDKIIIVCEDGQISSYVTSLLRMMGYGNVYAMRWGMSGWDKTSAVNGWLKGVSGKYESGLESKINEKPPALGMPDLKTGKSTGAEIAAERFRSLFAQGTSGILISADEVFSAPGNYFIINLERKDKYENGHIPGAVRYKPEATLGFISEMATIPADRTVVVYCGTGHNSGFATAYFRLFGYDARTLKYGNNSFMYDKMVKERVDLSWLPFTESEIIGSETVK